MAPPLHTVPAGKEAVIWSVPTVVGSYITRKVNNDPWEQPGDQVELTGFPFWVMVTSVLKLVPAPVGSTFAVTERAPSVPLKNTEKLDHDISIQKKETYALKSVELVIKVPVASATTAVLLSMADAISIVPQGFAVEGR